MARTFIRQSTQIRKSDTFSSVVTPAATMESGAVSIQDDLNNIRSILAELHDNQVGNWYDALTTPTGFENATVRGVKGISQELHNLERKRVLVSSFQIEDVVVGASDNFVILGAGNLPANTTIAIGAVTTLGTVVVTHGGTFGTHALTELSGATAISPKNLCAIVQADSHDPILSGGKVIYALLQSESSTDGSTASATTPNRLQLSFVRINAAGDDLEACPAVDIQGQTVHFVANERKALEDLTEQDFLKGYSADVPSSATVNQQVAYDNQGATVVTLGAYSPVIELADNQSWSIRRASGQNLFSVVRQSTGPAHSVGVGIGATSFSSAAAAYNEFSAGLTVNTLTQEISIGLASGVAGSALGVIQTTNAAHDLRLKGGRELFFDDGNQPVTWAQAEGIKLSDTNTEWANFETQFGEVSLLSAIVTAAQTAQQSLKTYHIVAGSTSADSDIGGTPSVDIAFPDMITNLTFATDVDVYLNGKLLRGELTSSTHDYYAGTASNQLKFEFDLFANDQICIVRRGA